MKKTQFIELIRSILVDKISFFSICLFVGFGIGLYCGLTWTNGAVHSSLDNLYNEGSIMSFTIDLPYSVSKDEVQTICDNTDIDYIEPTNCAYNFFKIGDEKFQAKVLTLSENLNVPISVEGRLPQASGEIAIEGNWAKNNGYKIGDKIVFEHDDDGTARFVKNVLSTDEYNIDVDNFNLKEYSSSGLSYIKTDTFTVTAFVENATNLTIADGVYGINPSNSIPNDCIMYITEDDFDQEAFTGYNKLLVRVDRLNDMSVFNSDYYEIEKQYKDSISDYADKINSEKYDSIINKCNNIQSQLQLKLDDASLKLIDARSQLTDYKNQLKNSHDQIDSARRELNNAKAMLPESVYKSKLQEINEAQQQYENSKGKITESQTEIDNNQNKYTEALSSFDDYKEAVGDIAKYDSVVTCKTDLDSYINISFVKCILDNMKLSLVLLFVIVGLLVCYTTITRIVSNRTYTIGIKKANGIPTKSIIMYYVWYCTFIVITGALVGGCVCAIPIELIVEKTIFDYYVVTDMSVFFDLFDWLFIAILELLIIVAIGVASVVTICKFKPILLLTNTYHLTKKSKTPWLKLKKCSAFYKVVIRNIFTERKRCIGTIVGITGCCVLLVTAFTFRFNIINSFDYQMENYYLFNHIITYDSDDEQSYEEIKTVLENNSIPYTNVCYDAVYLRHGDESVLAKIYVSDNSNNFDNLIVFKGEGEKDINLSNNPCIDVAFCDYFSLSENDTIEGTGMRGYNLSISNVQPINNYLLDVNLYLTPDQYINITGHTPKYNQFLIQYNDTESIQLVNQLKNSEGFLNIANFYDRAIAAYSIIDNITLIMALVYLGLSILNAIFTILTLFKISINEKKVNLIILKINGYGPKYSYLYVFFDMIFLTIVAFLLSGILGEILGNYSVTSFYTMSSYFRLGFNILAILIAIGITVALILAMGLLSVRDIKNLKITEINNVT